MKSLFTIVLVVSIAGHATAQQFDLKAAYFGESFSHYGLKAGVESSLFNSQKKNRFLYSGTVAVYRHAHNHVGVIVTPEVSWRRTGERGGFVEAGLSTSLFRYFYEGTTYERSLDGQFRKIPFAGRTAFLPGIAVGYGRDMSVTRNIPLSWYTRLVGMRQYPYNASSLTRIAIEIGVIKKLNTK